jgi:hypothetical protein
MLKAGSSQFRIPMSSLDFSIDLILPAALMALGSTQTNRNEYQDFSFWGKGRPARMAYNIAAVCGPTL